MPLSKAQQQIVECPIRFRVVVAGRRFGKTHLAIRELARHARFPNKTVWYLTGSRQQAKSLVWNKLKKKLRKLNWISSTNESELTIELVNGSTISLKSAEQGDTLRGASLSFLVVDEFADIELETVWSQILRPALSDQVAPALFIGTPKAGNQAARDLYDNYLTRKGWMSFSLTTAEGGFVTAEEIEAARQDLSPKIFSQEYLANWENFAGVIMYEFGEHNIKPVAKPTAHEALVVGLDFNVTPLCAQVGRHTSRGIEIFDEIILENSNTNEFCEELRNRYPTQPITVFPDPAGQQRKTSANGNTDIKILEMAGFKTRYHRAHPLVKDRINACNSLFFKREDGSSRFTIDPSCKYTIKSLKNWGYKPETMIPEKDSGWDHANDSLGYLIEHLYPIKKPVEQRAPQRFGAR
jgi:hypothetical protein